MPKWEYAHKVMPTNHEEVVKQLNELGQDGWELIDADPVNGLFSVFLKREWAEPKPELPKSEPEKV